MAPSGSDEGGELGSSLLCPCHGGVLCCTSGGMPKSVLGMVGIERWTWPEAFVKSLSS